MTRKKKEKEKKQGYYFLPGLSFGVRFFIIAILFLGGLVVQLFFSKIMPGVLMVFAGALLSTQRAISTADQFKRVGKEEWKTVTLEQWRRVNELKKNCSKWQSSISNINSFPGAVLLIAVIASVFILAAFVIDEDEMMFFMIVGNILAVYLPVLITGSLKAWSPPGIDIKIKALENIIYAFNNLDSAELELNPMLGLVAVKGKEGMMPVDAKLMLKFKNAPAGFYGVQVQCSLNDVSGTKYPYLYCVILTAPDFPKDPGKLPRPVTKNITFEPSSSAEAKLLVIRQKTSKTSGYHTDASTQVKIVRTALEIASKAF